MSDRGLFGQAEYLLDILHDDMGAIPNRPAFRDWVRTDLLPAAPSGQAADPAVARPTTTAAH